MSHHIPTQCANTYNSAFVTCQRMQKRKLVEPPAIHRSVWGYCPLILILDLTLPLFYFENCLVETLYSKHFLHDFPTFVNTIPCFSPFSFCLFHCFHSVFFAAFIPCFSPFLFRVFRCFHSASCTNPVGNLQPYKYLHA